MTKFNPNILQSVKTNAIRNSLNPEWKEMLMLSIPDDVPPLKVVSLFFGKEMHWYESCGYKISQLCKSLDTLILHAFHVSCLI